MDFYTFKDKIESYLPIDFYNEENNAYKKYLLEALEQNWINKKYQFCILATNMLFMSFLYKSFSFLIDKEIDKVKALLAQNQKMKVDNCFVLSVIPEKTFIDSYLSVFDFIPNKKDEVKRLIDVRDDCAHASGEIQYTLEDMESKFQEYNKQVEVVFKKHKEEVKKAFTKNYELFIEKELDAKTTFTFFDNWCKKEIVSIKEIKSIYDEAIVNICIKEDEDKYLRQLSIYVLKYYIALKSEFLVDYPYVKLKEDVVCLIENNKDKKETIINYLQNESTLNFDFVDSVFENLIKQLNEGEKQYDGKLVETDLVDEALQGYDIVTYDVMNKIIVSDTTETISDIDLEGLKKLVAGKSLKEIKNMISMIENEDGGED